MLARLFVSVLTLLSLLPVGINAVTLPVDPSNAAWATIRAKVPAEQPLYRPTWLPDRFTRPGIAATQGPVTGVTYTSDQGDNLLFVYGGSNSCTEPAVSTETVLVHGMQGLLGILPASCYPQITTNWQRGETTYTIAGNRSEKGRSASSREELLLVIAGLALVGPDGAALPQSAGSATPGSACHTQTGQCVAGPFQEYWRANGGLARNGYPLTGEMLERLEDGKLYQVQYFERVRMEYHPEQTDSQYRVLLGQFGRRIHGQVDPPATRASDAVFFPETGHNLGGAFRAYWEANGGLAQFGYPLTEEFTATLEDGKQYRVQYFERARFEHHPENADPYKVLLGQFGRRILNGR